ncbi:MAG: hypothetical protein JW809_11085 [Pirellulales bacterium]|nr:hypothetical protein [Pirellulales bacterium]
MRRTVPVRRARRRRDTTGVSLFPFLAVLICTMGALILLLVVMARRAQVQAAQEAQAEQAQAGKRLAENREDATWRIDHLRRSLSATEAQLADARFELGHLEDHARQLRDKLAALRRAWEQLSRTDAVQDNAQARDAQLAELSARIAQAETDLAAARQAAATRRQSYAVVPYQGPHGTQRRPIYLECTPRGIVFQPEGVVVGPNDLEGPLGPDNPLASALRAAREHLMRRGAFDPNKLEDEPYPLLLVRPSGVVAYYVARDALESWESEFGYELIGDDWTLEFPPADPALADVLRQAIDAGRLRQRMLAEAAPRHFNRYRGAQAAAPQEYTVSSGRGGVEPYRGGEAGFDAPPRGAGRSSRWPDAGRGSDGPSGSGSPNGLANGDGAGPSGGQGQPGTAGPSGGQGTADAAGGEHAPGAERRPGLYTPSASTPQGAVPSGDPSAAHAAPPARRAPSLAKTRGENWALPDASRRATPLTRPIRIECHPDRLVLVAQAGQFGGRTIPLGEQTEQAIDRFVSAVWDYTDTWGIAGERMYWRPVLNVYVAPGAAARYDDLINLLDGSGLVVERKQ